MTRKGWDRKGKRWGRTGKERDGMGQGEERLVWKEKGWEGWGMQG